MSLSHGHGNRAAEAACVLAVAITCAGCGNGKVSKAKNRTEAPRAAAPAAAAPRRHSAEPPRGVLNRWFALGSGCRARWDLPGDVWAESLDFPRESARYGMMFHLPEYALDSGQRGPADPLHFARECAIRVALNPPQGTQLVAVHAMTRVRSSAASSAHLTLLHRLTLGPVEIGRSLREWSAREDATVLEQDIALSGGRDTATPLPAMECAEPKIVGFDFTWITKLGAAHDDVRVELAGSKTIALEVELAPCAEEMKSSSYSPGPPSSSASASSSS